MIKKMTIVILLVSMLLLLCGCSRSINNPSATKETTAKAYIKINEETIVVDVKDYSISSIGTIEIYETDGKIYRTHWANVVLVRDTEGR